MNLRNIFITLVACCSIGLWAEEKPQTWDLSGCINYAFKNNIQIQKSKLTQETSAVTTKQAQAQLFPNLSAAINQNYSNNPFVPTNTYSGTYSISSSLTLFDGGKIQKNIQQQKLAEKSSQLDILSQEKNIQMAILKSYLQILYADESVKINKATLAVSTYQLERGQSLEKAGSISKADVAQLESQNSTDKYQLVVSENTLKTNKLDLKQLLELAAEEEISIVMPELNNVDILKPLPSLQSVYETALKVMPTLKSSKLSIQMAGLETQKAKSGYLPQIKLNAGIGTSNSSENISNQFKKGFYEGVGLSVSIPVFSNRENKSAVEKARISEKNANLNLLETEKTLLKEIETIYQDALSAQAQYTAAQEKVKSLKTSYELIEQQFGLGMKNTLQLLTEKNNLLAAQQNMLQAKYISIMNAQLLNVYQDFPIEIK